MFVLSSIADFMGSQVYSFWCLDF